MIKNDERVLYASLLGNLNQHEIYLQGATLNDNKLELTINQSKYRSYVLATGRAARVASSLAPDDVEIIEIYHLNANSEMARVSLDKGKFIQAVNKDIGNEELLMSSTISSAKEGHLHRAKFAPTPDLPNFSWKAGPALRSHIGGPEAFFMGQLWLKFDSHYIITRGLTLYTTIGISLYDNFEFNNPSESKLPHVRSDIQSYMEEGKSNIARMKFDYLWSPADNWYARLDLGLIEEMFGGIGGEVLYRPYNSKFALGLVAHKVKQRAFDQRFSFRDYETETGHLELYYDFPDGVTSQVLIGKYLAGDKGLTLDFSKRFKTGFRLGVFATKTNISAQEFGEGSFDKGFYFQIPTDIFLSNYSTGSIAYGLHPLTKDGGATLFHHNSLWSLLGNTEYNGMFRDWDDIVD